MTNCRGSLQRRAHSPDAAPIRLNRPQFDVPNIVSQTIDYDPDGRVHFIHNLSDSTFDRSFAYDRTGGLKQADAGGAARNDYGDVPYSESFQYDEWSNTTSRHTSSWSQEELEDSAAYENNQRIGWG